MACCNTDLESTSHRDMHGSHLSSVEDVGVRANLDGLITCEREAAMREKWMVATSSDPQDSPIASIALLQPNWYALGTHQRES
jgi:hypothetical protein